MSPKQSDTFAHELVAEDLENAVKPARSHGVRLPDVA